MKTVVSVVSAWRSKKHLELQKNDQASLADLVLAAATAYAFAFFLRLLDVVRDFALNETNSFA